MSNKLKEINMRTIIALSVVLLGKTAFAQSDEEYKDFTKKFQKVFRVTEEEAKKFTDRLKEARKGYEESVNKLSDILNDETLVKRVKPMLPYITEQSIDFFINDIEADKKEKLLELAKNTKEKLTGWEEKLKGLIDEEKAKKITFQLKNYITQEKLPVPMSYGPKTDEERTEDIIDEMGIEDKEKKVKCTDIVKKIFKLQAEKRDLSRDLMAIARKQDVTDEEVNKAKELIKSVKARGSEIEKAEDELLGLVSAKQYLAYLKGNVATTWPINPGPK